MEKTELEEIIKRQRDVIRKKNDIIRSLCEAISNVHEYYNSAEALNAIQAAISKPVKRKLIDITQYPNEADLDSNNEDHNANGDCSQLTKADKENNSQCMLCLFPLNESLHGSFYPKTYKLKCGHTFHLLCLFETVQRRECRKTCGECWVDITAEDQEIILSDAKIEKKEIVKCSQKLATEIRELDISFKVHIS